MFNSKSLSRELYEIKGIHNILKSLKFENLIKKDSLIYLIKLRKCLENHTFNLITFLNKLDGMDTSSKYEDTKLNLFECIIASEWKCKLEEQSWVNISNYLNGNFLLYIKVMILYDHKCTLLKILSILIELYGKFENSSIWQAEKNKIYSKDPKIFKYKQSPTTIYTHDANECKICSENMEVFSKSKTCICKEPNTCLKCMITIFFNGAKGNINEFQSKCPFCRNSFTLNDIQPIKLIQEQIDENLSIETKENENLKRKRDEFSLDGPKKFLKL